LAAVAVACYIGWTELQPFWATAQTQASTPTKSDIKPLSPEELKARLDDLKWLLTLLIGVAAIFAIAQSAAAFFNAQTFTKQSEDALKRIQEAARDAEENYPTYAAELELTKRATDRILAEKLEKKDFDWRDSVYGELDLADRQRVLAIDRIIAVEARYQLGQTKDEVRVQADALALRRLAQFFASKYLYERRRNAANLADLEKAEYYLRLACDLTDDAYYLLSDLGVLQLEFYSPRNLELASTLFQRSLNKRKAQQRAHYNLGVVAAYKQDWAEASRKYKHALSHSDWDESPLPRRRCEIWYNLACAKAQLSYQEDSEAKRLVRECIDALDEAARIGQMTYYRGA
jgi:hypothetical protein